LINSCPQRKKYRQCSPEMFLSDGAGQTPPETGASVFCWLDESIWFDDLIYLSKLLIEFAKAS
jgi:hypothetical protein